MSLSKCSVLRLNAWLIILHGVMCLEKIAEQNRTYIHFNQYSPSRFAPYYTSSKSLEQCQPTGMVDKEHYCLSNIYVNKVNREEEEYRGYMYVPLMFKFERIFLEAYFLRGGSIVPIYQRETRNVCQDLVYSSFLRDFVNPDKNCNVKAGNYTIRAIHLNELTHLVTGKYFIHEQFVITLKCDSDKGAVFCLKMILETKPIGQKKKTPVRNRNKDSSL